MPNFALFKFDVDGIVDIFSTNLLQGDFVPGGGGKVQFKNQILDGIFKHFKGKNFLCYSSLIIQD